MKVKEQADLSFESHLWAGGYGAIAGLDEAGRGAWAGPVVAAAVILPADPAALAPLLGRVNDSKQLTPHARDALRPDCHLRAGGRRGQRARRRD